MLTHRVYDYHPDHRAVGLAVQDASYLVTVPRVEPEVPALAKDPVVAYLPDLFTRPYPLVADVAVDVSQQFGSIVRMLACHRSQVFEWLPYLARTLQDVPAEDEARMVWLGQWYASILRPRAERYRAALAAVYGDARAAKIEHAEVFEISQYAAPLDAAARRRLFFFQA